MIKKGIYNLMQESWEAYALMSAIIYIEEMSKPTKHIQIKTYKNKKYYCDAFHSVRLKMNNPEVVQKYFDLTKRWQKMKESIFIGKTFNSPRKEKYSGQDVFFLSPIWLNEIISTCGTIPNKYSLETSVERINNFVQYKKIPINRSKDLFESFFSDKVLAAGAFVVSMDMECRGVQSGNVSLCMSEKYKDFLMFMLSIAKQWGWTNNQLLSSVDVSYSKKLGIHASPQYEFRLSIEGLKEIYALAGPLADSFKDKCIKFHVNRSNEFKNLGYGLKKNNTHQKIFDEVNKLGEKGTTSTNLQFAVGVRTDVILEHLYRLEKEGKVSKERKGKRYVWKVLFS